MDKFVTHTGIAVALNRANVDTDAIIPKQFLKSIKRTGFGSICLMAGVISTKVSLAWIAPHAP